MCVCMCVGMCVSVSMCVCMCVCMCIRVCMCICTHICMYIYLCIYVQLLHARNNLRFNRHITFVACIVITSWNIHHMLWICHNHIPTYTLEVMYVSWPHPDIYFTCVVHVMITSQHIRHMCCVCHDHIPTYTSHLLCELCREEKTYPFIRSCVKPYAETAFITMWHR